MTISLGSLIYISTKVCVFVCGCACVCVCARARVCVRVVCFHTLILFISFFQDGSNEVIQWVYENPLSCSSLIYPSISFVKSYATKRKYKNLAYTSVNENPSASDLGLRLDITLCLQNWSLVAKSSAIYRGTTTLCSSIGWCVAMMLDGAQSDNSTNLSSHLHLKYCNMRIILTGQSRIKTLYNLRSIDSWTLL
jgi:hypothetical protein